VNGYNSHPWLHDPVILRAGRDLNDARTCSLRCARPVYLKSVVADLRLARSLGAKSYGPEGI